MTQFSKCPVCKRVASEDVKPFCSTRCKEVDLGRWFTGAYVAAGKDGDVFASEEGEALMLQALGEDEDNIENMQ
jgi:endogenous inhibitor of DNA gyrase (YacG/DUF329 family)